MAEELEIENASTMRKGDMMFAILKELAERDALEIQDLVPFQIIRSFDKDERRSLLGEAMDLADVTLPRQLVTNSLPLARSLVLQNHGIGIYSKIGFLDEIEHGALRYIKILSPVLAKLRMGVMISSRHNPSPATHLMLRSISKALSVMKLDS